MQVFTMLSSVDQIEKMGEMALFSHFYSLC
jgi:hypothetical protein